MLNDLALQIAGSLKPFDFERFVAGGKNGLHVDVDRLGFGPLLRRVASIEIVDEAHGLTAIRDVGVNAIDCFSLGHTVVCNEAEIPDLIEHRCTSELVIGKCGLVCWTGRDLSAEIVDCHNVRDHPRPHRKSD